MPSSARVLARMDERVQELSTDLIAHVEAFANAERFSGPSLYFHRRTIDSRRDLGSSGAAIESDQFVEFLYATLTSWGMHRMGPGNTKLREFGDICATLRANRDQILSLEHLALSRLSQGELGVVADQVWQLIDSLAISIADAKIVANTKTLHHLLPDLVPPIDRTYTYSFFYGCGKQRTNLSITERDAFHEMFTRFHRVATKNVSVLGGLVGPGWNTSETKILDNAVVGHGIGALNVVPE